MSNLFLTLSNSSYGYEITLQITTENYQRAIKTEHFAPFRASLDDLINFLDPILQNLIDSHAVKRVYTYGDHKCLRKLNSLSTIQPIIDIRDSRIAQNCIIDLNRSSYSNCFIGCENFPQSRGVKVLPDDISESINNLCFLISKNIIIGYDVEYECVCFNVKKRYPMYCTYHCKETTAAKPFSRCTITLSEMNIFKWTVLNWARKLLDKLDRKYTLVEFILQCVFINLAFPLDVTYSSSDSSYLDIYISNVRVLSMGMENDYWLHPKFWSKYVEYIRELISVFNTVVLQLDKVSHDGLLERLLKIMVVKEGECENNYY